MHLFRGRWLLEPFTHKESLIATPDKCAEASFGHQAGCADITERIVSTLHECDEAIALKNEVGSDFRRDELDVRCYQLLENFRHVLIHIL